MSHLQSRMYAAMEEAQRARQKKREAADALRARQHEYETANLRLGTWSASPARDKPGESTMDGFLRLGALCVRPFQSICEIHADLSLGSRCRTVFFAPNGPGCPP